MNADGPWRASVSTDTDDGHMAEYNEISGQYISGGSELQNTLSVRAEGGNNLDLSSGGILIEGNGTEGEIHIPVVFEQEIT